MGKLDSQHYVLKDQWSLPKEERILITYHIPTFGDDMSSRRFSRKETDPEAQSESFVVARVASTLDKTEGFKRNGVADEFPADADMATRVAWVLRLPPSWGMELVSQVSEESDLTLEDE